MALWRFSAREIGRRCGRAVLTLLSIAISIAAVVAVSLGTATTQKAYDQMYAKLAGHAALQVTAEGGGSFDQGVAAALERFPGVQAAVPSLQRLTVMYFGHKRFTLLLIGIDPSRDREVRQYRLREGRYLHSQQEDGALLETNFARGSGIRVGDEVKVMTPQGWPPLKRVSIVGLVAPTGVANFQQGGLLFVPMGLAEDYFTAFGQINTIDLVLKPKVDPRRIATELQHKLPPGLEVHPPATHTELAEETLLSIQQGLQFSSEFSIALAVILIVNTFLMNVSERRRQLAILRTVGATRRQIVRMFLVEGLVLGVLGTILGCALGAAGGSMLMRGITRLYAQTPPPITFSWWAFLLAAGLGPVVAVAAAAVPAILAARVSPMEAMQPVLAADGSRIPRWLTLSGIVLMVVSGGLLALGVQGRLPLVVTIPVAVVSMAAFVLLIPWLVGPLGRIASWLLSPMLRLEGRLAHRQIRRRPVRTALTLGVLYMAVSLGIGQGTAILNSIQNVRAWFRQTMLADFIVRAAAPNAATGQTIELPLSLRGQIEKVPGVTHVGAVRFFSATAADHRVSVVARDFTGTELPLDLYRGDPSDIRRRLKQGEVVIGTVLAQHAGLRVGGTITLQTRQGAKSLRVAGLAVDYMTGGYIVVMGRTVAERLFGVQGADAFLIQASSRDLPAVRVALARIAQAHGLVLHSFAELRRKLDAILAGLVGGLWGILALGFIVAALGIANTLSMNVLEQTHDLALLRVVAMTRGQIRKMVLSQAGLLGLIGMALGVGSGITAAYIITWSMMPLVGFPVPFALHPLLIVGCFVGGMTLVLLAAWVPAKRAARLDLPVALHE